MKSFAATSLLILMGASLASAKPLPTGPVRRPASVRVQAETTKILPAHHALAADTLLSEGFEGIFPDENNWTLAAEPTVPYTWDDESSMAHAGSWSGWCAGGVTNQNDPDLDPSTDNYPNNVNSWMIWGPFSLADASAASVQFWYWNRSESGADHFAWLASVDGNSFWGLQVSGNSNGWQQVNFPLDAVPTLGNLLGRPQVWIAFRFSSNGSVNEEGAFVDQVLLTKELGTPPVVTHTAVTMASQGTAIPIAATITDNGTVTAKVHYRLGGAAMFQEAGLTAAGTMYSGAIPAAVVGSRGVDYYVSATDGQATTFSPAGGAANPVRVPVALANAAARAAQPGGSAQNAFRMISFPLELAVSAADALLADDLGAYDNKKWRLFRYEGGAYLEYPDARAATIAVGKAYWLIVRDPNRVIDAAGTSSASRDSVVLTLEPGWNDIGLPFDFPVNWADVRVARSSVDGPYSYEGAWTPNATRLEPWKGYAVRNLGTTAITLAIPPREAIVPLSKARDADDVIAADWLVQIEARCEAARDAMNFVGWAPGATAGEDATDISEPPPIGEYVSLYFPSAGRRGRCTNDLRAHVEPGDIWHVAVETNVQSGAPIVLTWSGFDALPSDLEARIVDPTAGTVHDPRRDANLAIDPSTRPGTRELLLVVGRPDFVAAQAQLAATPRRFALAQNHPNPFNPSTEIRFDLPVAGEVTLDVFDALGRRVRNLIAGPRDAGRHRVVWDGLHDDGRSAPSGMYFYRLDSPHFHAARKAILVR